MNRQLRSFAGICLLLLPALFVLHPGDLAAQEKHRYFFKPPPGTSKYTQTHVLEVGDVPRHQLRIAELQSKFGEEAPVYDGVKVREARAIIFSDYVAGTGNAILHTVSTLENGDKVYSRGNIMARTAAGADGGPRVTFTTVTTLTGGTGRFKAIRGTLWTTGFSDLKTGTSGTQTEGEYWFEQ
jgi:hypothetical protein